MFKKIRKKSKSRIKKQSPSRGSVNQKSEWRQLHRVADSIAPRMEEEFLEAMAEVSDDVSKNKIREALRDGRLRDAEDAIDWDKMEEVIGERMSGVIRDGIEEGGTVAQEFVPVEAVFDIENPKIAEKISELSLRLAGEVTETTRESVRGILDRGFREGVSPLRMANEIQQSVGLTPQFQNAVRNRWNRAVDVEGLSVDEADRIARQYSQRLRRIRAETIARTESIRVASQGQQAMWEQLVDDGTFSSNELRKVWIVTDDDRTCEYCLPMDGQEVGMNELFTSELGSVENSPLHPNCRCSTALRVVR